MASKAMLECFLYKSKENVTYEEKPFVLLSIKTFLFFGIPDIIKLEMTHGGCNRRDRSLLLKQTFSKFSIIKSKIM